MIQDKNRIYDGWLSLEGGVDAGRAPELIDVNEAVSAENMTFRGGKPGTRPGFRIINETFEPMGHDGDPGQVWCYATPHLDVRQHLQGEYANPNDVRFEESWFRNQNSEYIYRHGVFQTAMAFSPHNKSADCIMALIGGRLFKITPGHPDITEASVDEFIITDTEGPQLRNREDSTIAYMAQGDKYLFAQDGDSRCIIYTAGGARRAKLNVSRDNTEVPVGTIMAYGMGRLCVVVNERDIAFGDLFGSHDLPDPADSVPFFTERNFLTGGFDAAIPFNQGNVTGLAFFPQLDTSTGNGQLLAFAERGAAAFFLNLPRELWQTSAFQILALLTTGLRGHRSISVVNEDLWFRSDDGMRSYRQARSEPSGWAHIPLSTNVRQFLENDTDWMLKYTSAIYFDNRIIVTTSPIPNQGKPVHGGMVVVDFDILSSFGKQLASKPAWEGHWTFPQGIQVIQLLTGIFNGVTRAFAFCLVDGQNQLFEISIDDKDDWGEQLIPWELVSRAFDFSKLTQQSSPFSEVELYGGDIWLKDIIE